MARCLAALHTASAHAAAREGIPTYTDDINKPGEDGTGWFGALNPEYAWVAPELEPSTRALELRPIIGVRSDKWVLAANPNLGWAWTDQRHGPLEGKAIFETPFDWTLTMTRPSLAK